MFELADTTAQRAVIKVIGVGGAGCNAVRHMVSRGPTTGIQYICANTDAQHLASSTHENIDNLQLGTKLTRGLGAGSNPEVGCNAALEDEDKISDLLEDTDMLFVAAGMGGGTGTGSAPVIARIAREKNILVVGVITRPFSWQGRDIVAQKGIDELRLHADAVVIVPNDKILDEVPDETSAMDGFSKANDVLTDAVKGVSDLVLCPGVINLDFADIKTVMSEAGSSVIGVAQASGEDRAMQVFTQAASSPLLENVSLHHAKGILVNILAHSADEVKMKELSIIGSQARAVTDNENVPVVFGTAVDSNIEPGVLRLTLVATGLQPEVDQQERHDEHEEKDFNEKIIPRGGMQQSVLDNIKQDEQEPEIDHSFFLR